MKERENIAEKFLHQVMFLLLVVGMVSRGVQSLPCVGVAQERVAGSMV